jgi:putative serine protease PepD
MRLRPLPFLAILIAACCAPFWVLALSRDEENNVDIYRRFNAGVVNITSRAVGYDFFFRPVPTDSSGSGVILDAHGHILTNNHVIKGSQRLEVSLTDRTKWPAKVVGADPHTDLAVVVIKAPPESLTVMPLGDSSGLQVGQKVLAIGNPFGLEHSLSAGIISMIRKVVKAGETEIEDVIQTDAAINPGNSGGPLLDSEGKVIGINTAIFTPSGGNVGIGFAIPINTAKRVVADVLKYGYVIYPYFGADTQTVTPLIARALQLPVERGAVIVRVWKDSPAAKAELIGGTQQVVIGNTIVVTGGDIVTAADSEVITSSEELRRFIRRHLPGDIIRLEVIRQGKRGMAEVKLGERPRERLSLKD